MKKGANVTELSRDEWLELRRKGIGGSDAAAVAGLSPWKSAAAVYLDKVGETKPTEDSERMRIGRDLEDYVARRFAEATGKKVRRNNYMLHHDDYPFILADIDREIIGENAILECKTTGSYSRKDWEAEPPLHYQIQCLHYMLVTGAERCYIAALVGNEAFVWHVIERDEETLQSLLDIEVRFWTENVEAGICPPPDGSEAYDDLLQRMHPVDDGGSVMLSADSSKALERYIELTAAAKELDALIKLQQQIIKAEMGDHQTAYDGERKVTWKTQTRTTLDTKAIKAEQPELFEAYSKTTESRVFRVGVSK